jgi:glutathione S-transferase
VDETLILYTNPMSRGRIARWMLEETGVPYEARILPWGQHKSADYRALNPMGKVPTLVHGETVVSECAAICAYLADMFPEAGLAPKPGTKARGAYYRWLFFAAGPIEASVSDKAMGLVIPDAKKAMIGYGNLDDVLDMIEYAVTQGDYLLGDQFSAADVYFGSQVRWGLQFGSLLARPAFEAYAQRLGQRPALIRATEIDDALIAASKTN